MKFHEAIERLCQEYPVLIECIDEDIFKLDNDRFAVAEAYEDGANYVQSYYDEFEVRTMCTEYWEVVMQLEIWDKEVEVPENFLDPTTPSALELQEGGDHYKDLGIQPIEYIIENNLDFIQGNMIKYATRHKEKGGKEDLLKVIHYANLAIELQYGEDLCEC
jgi:hypothetical protein